MPLKLIRIAENMARIKVDGLVKHMLELNYLLHLLFADFAQASQGDLIHTLTSGKQKGYKDFCDGPFANYMYLVSYPSKHSEIAPPFLPYSLQVSLQESCLWQSIHFPQMVLAPS